MKSNFWGWGTDREKRSPLSWTLERKARQGLVAKVGGGQLPLKVREVAHTKHLTYASNMNKFRLKDKIVFYFFKFNKFHDLATVELFSLQNLKLGCCFPLCHVRHPPPPLLGRKQSNVCIHNDTSDWIACVDSLILNPYYPQGIVFSRLGVQWDLQACFMKYQWAKSIDKKSRDTSVGLDLSRRSRASYKQFQSKKNLRKTSLNEDNVFCLDIL